MSDSDLTTLLREHRESAQGHWITPDGVYMRCVCGEALHPIDHPAHVASVLSGVYAITPLPEKPKPCAGCDYSDNSPICACECHRVRS